MHLKKFKRTNAEEIFAAKLKRAKALIENKDIERNRSEFNTFLILDTMNHFVMLHHSNNYVLLYSLMLSFYTICFILSSVRFFFWYMNLVSIFTRFDAANVYAVFFFNYIFPHLLYVKCFFSSLLFCMH